MGAGVKKQRYVFCSICCNFELHAAGRGLKHLIVANTLGTKTLYINIMGTVQDNVQCVLKTGQLAYCFL